MTTRPNANFTSLGGTSVHETGSERYREYRRRWEENPRHHIVEPFPIHLDFEITQRCNLACTFCDRQPFLLGDAPEDMDYDLFRRIVDEGAAKGLCSVKLSYSGEPLLHPRLVDMVAHAASRGMLDIYFNTNAMLLDARMFTALAEAGLTRLSISVEGTDPEEYERMRRGASFARLLGNVRRLKELRQQCGRTTPAIRIQTVRLPGLDLDQYTDFWLPHCDEVATVDYNEPTTRKGLTGEWTCPQLWQRMTVLRDGTVIPCNNDTSAGMSPGNANHMSIEACWTSPVVERARQAHLAFRSHEVGSCDGCPWRTTQLAKEIGF